MHHRPGSRGAAEAGRLTAPGAPQNVGIPMADIKKLIEGNIHTVDALAHMPKRELTNIKGLSDAKVEKMQKEGAAR